jgi:hypothetical protein
MEALHDIILPEDLSDVYIRKEISLPGQQTICLGRIQM